jgi:transcriptional regulator with XRE-family HTH domain
MNLLEPAEIEALAGQAGFSMAEVCRRAGISQSTFTRWKAGRTEPTLDVYRKLHQAVSPALASRDPAPVKDMLPMGENASPGRRQGFAEPNSPYRFATVHPTAIGMTTDSEADGAAAIFARIARDLPAEEARADRLLRLYNL